MDDSVRSQKILIELVKVLYQQITTALWTESLAAICLVIALWGTISNSLLLTWLSLNLLLSGFARHVLVYAFNQHKLQALSSYRSAFRWLILFSIGVAISGISWGFAGYFLMIENDMIRQSFVIFLLIGIVSAANTFYSPVRSVYMIFLFTAFLPFILWLLTHGSIFAILGLLALIYTIIMISTSFYLHDLITKSLELRFENLDLVGDLSTAKHILEARSIELEKSLSLARATLESTTDGIVVVDNENIIEDFNQKFLDMWEIPAKYIAREKNIRNLMYLTLDQIVDVKHHLRKIYELQRNPEMEAFEEINLKDGRVLECYSRPQYVGDKVVGRVWCFRDITDRKSVEEKLFHQANFDSLTQLPNRDFFIEQFKQAIAFDKQQKLNLAVLFLDLDHFKIINDTLGHQVGDKLLKLVAKRLLNCVRETDIVSRGGGDEFIIVLSSLKNEEEIVKITMKILERISKPFIIEENKFNISTSIGISIYPENGNNPEALIKHADIAMYKAKELGRNNFQFFSEEMIS